MNASALNRIKALVSTQETTRNQLTNYENGTIDKSSTGRISNSSVTAASMGTADNGLRPRGRQVDGEMAAAAECTAGNRWLTAPAFKFVDDFSWLAGGGTCEPRRGR